MMQFSIEGMIDSWLSTRKNWDAKHEANAAILFSQIYFATTALSVLKYFLIYLV